MTAQLDLDRRLRQAILSDVRVVCALAYGSLTQGTGDRYSDLEYYLFVPHALTPRFDPQAFLARLTPVRHFVINDFGTPNFITDNLLRIELHVEPVERLSDILSWPGYHIDPGRMLVKDSGGQLAAVYLISAGGQGSSVRSADLQAHQDVQRVLVMALGRLHHARTEINPFSTS